MPKVHLTELTLNKLKAPEKGQIHYTDTAAGFPGFGVVVGTQARAYVLMHGTADQRVKTTIGKVGIISLAEARKKAKTILAERMLNPNAPKALPFEEALATFIKLHCSLKNKASTAAETERLLRRHFEPKLRGRNIHDLETPAYMEIVEELLDTPSEANHAFTAIRTMTNWFFRRKVLKTSPLGGLELPTRTTSRDRVLTHAELHTLAQALDFDQPYDAIVGLLLLTGQREGQIANLRGEWINRQEKTITFPGHIMKGNQPHTIPYGDRAAEIIATLPDIGLCFPSDRNPKRPFNNWGGSKHALDKRLQFKAHWTLHDLRRSLSTHLAELGVPPHVIDKLTDHKTGAGAVKGVSAIYNRWTYLPEQREALALYEQHLSRSAKAA